MNTIGLLEAQLAALKATERLYHLKENSLLDRVALVIQIQAQLNDKIFALEKLLVAEKSSRDPKTFFHRHFSK